MNFFGFTLMLFSFFVINNVSQAQSAWQGPWVNELSCNNGSALVESRQTYTGYRNEVTTQIVVRDRGVIRYFSEKQAVFVEGQDLVFMHVRQVEPGVWVDHGAAYSVDGRLVRASRTPQGGLFLQVFRTTQPSGGIYVLKEEIANWYFERCE